MRQYKGVYIDHVFIHNKQDVEDFLKRRALEAFKNAHELFYYSPTYAMGIECERCAGVLHDKHGMSWDEIEELEAKICQERERQL